MVSLKTLCKQNLTVAIPIMASSCAVMLCAIGSAQIVSAHAKVNWYFLGLFLPISFVILGLLESGRLCALRCASLSHKSSTLLWQLRHFALIHAGFIIILMLMLSLIFLTDLDNYYIPANYHRSFFIFSITYTASYLLVSTNSIFNAALFGLGKNKTALALIVSISGIFFILTFSLYYATPLGLYALIASTAIAYLIGSYIAWSLLKYFVKTDSDVKAMDGTDWLEVKSLFINSGLPVFFAYLTMPCALFAFNKILLLFGEATVAAFGIAYRLQMIFIIPSLAVGIAGGILSNRSEVLYKLQHKTVAVGMSALMSAPLILGLFLFNHWISQLFSTAILIQENMQLYFHYLTFSYAGFLPLITLIAYWEQTGAATLGLMLNSFVIVCQILAGIVATQQQNLSLFYFLSSSIMLLASTVTIIFSLLRSRRCFLCTASTI